MAAGDGLALTIGPSAHVLAAHFRRRCYHRLLPRSRDPPRFVASSRSRPGPRAPDAEGGPLLRVWQPALVAGLRDRMGLDEMHSAPLTEPSADRRHPCHVRQRRTLALIDARPEEVMPALLMAS
jgi:hypothetical protein